MSEATPLWETSELRQAAGATLRPGGFSLTDRAAEVIGMVPGWRVLDVGGGLGATVSRLRSRFGAEAWGVEPSFIQVQRAGKHANLIQAQGDALPFADESFHAVFCECVLSLFADPGKGLEEFYRVLAPRGFLVLADLHAEEGGQDDADSCAARSVPIGVTRTMVEAHGFALHTLEDHSRHLRDLAARLVLAGKETRSLCARRCGYYLMIAQKKGADHAG